MGQEAVACEAGKECGGACYQVIAQAEEHGGLGLGMVEAALAAEALGAAVAPAPFLGSAVLAPLALRLAGSPEQQAQFAKSSSHKTHS